LSDTGFLEHIFNFVHVQRAAKIVGRDITAHGAKSGAVAPHNQNAMRSRKALDAPF
jgi:hypothetical protein